MIYSTDKKAVSPDFTSAPPDPSQLPKISPNRMSVQVYRPATGRAVQAIIKTDANQLTSADPINAAIAAIIFRVLDRLCLAMGITSEAS